MQTPIWPRPPNPKMSANLGITQLPNGVLPEVVPNISIVIVSGYSITNQTSTGHGRRLQSGDNFGSDATQKWLVCVRRMMHDAWGHLKNSDDSVRLLNIANLPAANELKAQWKKLAGIIAAAEMGADLIVWHDGDAMPHPQGELVARARLLAAAQPTTDFWVAPGEPSLYGLPFMTREDDFWGDTMVAVKRTRVRLHSISMHTGVMMMRAAAGRRMAEQVISRYYDADVAAMGADHLSWLVLPCPSITFHARPSPSMAVHHLPWPSVSFHCRPLPSWPSITFYFLAVHHLAQPHARLTHSSSHTPHTRHTHSTSRACRRTAHTAPDHRVPCVAAWLC